MPTALRALLALLAGLAGLHLVGRGGDRSVRVSAACGTPEGRDERPEQRAGHRSTRLHAKEGLSIWHESMSEPAPASSLPPPLNQIVITGERLQVGALAAAVVCPTAGGIATFSGTTRDSFQGKRVLRLEVRSPAPLAPRHSDTHMRVATVRSVPADGREGDAGHLR